VSAGRARAAQTLGSYGTMPSYRAMLDREGAEGPADVAIVGDESHVGEQLERLADAGATDFLAVPFRVEGDPEAVERTRALLVRLAARG
jgi:5,10-methylenetetrahydromethanopterin reductase